MENRGMYLPRRDFLGRTLMGTLGLAFSPAIQRQLAASPGDAPRAQRCIVLWLNGGPSHLDTFDPKPEGASMGAAPSIETVVPGIRLASSFPKLAGRANQLAIVRSLTSAEADHERASLFLRTGNLPQETVAYPALGSVVAKRWSSDEAALPTFVAINGETVGPGFFGREFAPYTIGDPSSPFENVQRPANVSDRSMTRRLRALEDFNRGFARRSNPEIVADHDRLVSKAHKLMGRSSLEALDLSKEKPEVLARYGASDEGGNFGRGCLLARRLIEQGVRFVEVTLDGWDTHTNNLAETASLSARLDPAFAALLGELEERGLLDETLVICMGEFGRTPTLNPEGGRDHWSEAFSAILAGGGIRGGQVVGETDATGSSIKNRPVTVPDLFATLLTTLGVDGSKSYRTPEGRPIRLVDKGQIVQELIGS